MADIKPFAALRPRPDLAVRICELPYDVMSSEEAREIAAVNPLSFLHVSKPEIDLPVGTDPHAPEVYAKGRENLEKLIRQGALRQEDQPCFYLYRQIMGTHAQTGLVAVVSCEDYLRDVIKKHELTRPDKEDDRVRHIETLDAQTGPAFLTYRRVEALDELITRRSAGVPDADFIAADGVRHTAWTISEARDIQRIRDEFARMPGLYVADGHHRSAAAARVFQKRRGAGHSTHFLAVIFPHNQTKILPYNRLVKDLNGLDQKTFLQRLAAVCDISSGGGGTPAHQHDVRLCLAGQWHTLLFPQALARNADTIEQLDVTLLQRYILSPILGITDPRTSGRLSFVGGIRGTAELEKHVNSGEWACAFSLFPTSIEDLMAIADAGRLMPPKSTWFEPKLRDAMFSHLI